MVNSERSVRERFRPERSTHELRTYRQPGLGVSDSAKQRDQRIVACKHREPVRKPALQSFELRDQPASLAGGPIRWRHPMRPEGSADDRPPGVSRWWRVGGLGLHVCIVEELTDRILPGLFTDKAIVELRVQVLEQDRRDQLGAAQGRTPPTGVQVMLQHEAVDDPLDPSWITPG